MGFDFEAATVKRRMSLALIGKTVYPRLAPKSKPDNRL
jgi:hypothetical protein